MLERIGRLSESLAPCPSGQLCRLRRDGAVRYERMRRRCSATNGKKCQNHTPDTGNTPRAKHTQPPSVDGLAASRHDL